MPGNSKTVALAPKERYLFLFPIIGASLLRKERIFWHKRDYLYLDQYRVLPEIVDTRNAGSIELWFICPLCNGKGGRHISFGMINCFKRVLVLTTRIRK